MRRIRKIIILIICVIIIAVATYGYKVFSSKEDLGESFMQIGEELGESQVSSPIDCTNNSCILVVKPGFLACNVSEINYEYNNAGNTVDYLKNNTQGLIEKKNGKLKVNIYKYNEDELVESFTVNSGEELSKWVLLKKGATYIVTYGDITEDGLFILNMTKYDL